MEEQLSIEDAVSLLTTRTAENAEAETPVADDDVSQAESLEEQPEAIAVEDDSEQSDDDDDASEAEEAELAEDIEVIIDGEKQRVTREEAAKGYQRQADYSRKTAEVAKQRKAVEAEAQQIAAERAQYAQALELIQSQLSSEEQPDWASLKEDDPYEYMLKKDAWRDKQERLAQVQAEQRRVQQQQMREQQAAMQQEIAKQSEVLLDRIPTWRDSKVAEVERSGIVDYAKSVGFSQDEIDSVVDARAVQLLHKAWKFDELMKKQNVEAKRVKSAPKAAKGGQPTGSKERTSRQRQAAFDKLKQSGRVEDALDYMLLRKGK